ncbi:MAG: response regulator [Bacteroidales bacterium]|nr:response regulator [Bacteroidales bacterium]MBN2750718.1 response regulator [Bacteroidales bacterium]
MLAVNWSGKTVLIVEDDRFNALILENFIKPTGVNVLTATSGEMGVEMAGQNEIHLILMDIKLPGISGIEATQQIRKFNPTVPIIAQTAYATDTDKESAITEGCNSFITKPINRLELLRLMGEYLK